MHQLWFYDKHIFVWFIFVNNLGTALKRSGINMSYFSLRVKDAATYSKYIHLNRARNSQRVAHARAADAHGLFVLTHYMLFHKEGETCYAKLILIDQGILNKSSRIEEFASIDQQYATKDLLKIIKESDFPSCKS